jgi:hypothetical protein
MTTSPGFENSIDQIAERFFKIEEELKINYIKIENHSKIYEEIFIELQKHKKNYSNLNINRRKLKDSISNIYSELKKEKEKKINLLLDKCEEDFKFKCGKILIPNKSDSDIEIDLSDKNKIEIDYWNGLIFFLKKINNYDDVILKQKEVERNSLVQLFFDLIEKINNVFHEKNIMTIINIDEIDTFFFYKKKKYEFDLLLTRYAVLIKSKIENKTGDLNQIKIKEKRELIYKKYIKTLVDEEKEFSNLYSLENIIFSKDFINDERNNLITEYKKLLKNAEERNKGESLKEDVKGYEETFLLYCNNDPQFPNYEERISNIDLYFIQLVKDELDKLNFFITQARRNKSCSQMIQIAEDYINKITKRKEINFAKIDNKEEKLNKESELLKISKHVNELKIELKIKSAKFVDELVELIKIYNQITDFKITHKDLQIDKKILSNHTAELEKEYNEINNKIKEYNLADYI